MGSRRLRDLGTALLAKDVEQGLTPLEKEMLNAILRILEERGENVGRMIHERLIQGYRWSVRTYYGNEVAYSHFESREEAEKLAERLRKTGVRAEVVPFRREYIQ
jgi:predicted ArsR family transcriptional regulator